MTNSKAWIGGGLGIHARHQSTCISPNNIVTQNPGMLRPSHCSLRTTSPSRSQSLTHPKRSKSKRKSAKDLKRKKRQREIQRMVAATEEIQESKPTTKMIKIHLYRTTMNREVMELSDKI